MRNALHRSFATLTSLEALRLSRCHFFLLSLDLDGSRSSIRPDQWIRRKLTAIISSFLYFLFIIY